MTPLLLADLRCPICDGNARAHDVVDFNKSCAEGSGTFLPLSGIAIYYYRCQQCGFCYAPEMHGWTPQAFAQRVYNDDYTVVDPDWVEARPRGNARLVSEVFANAAGTIRHLDYGGGIGLMSDLLQGDGWDSTSYDPFVDRDVDPQSLGTFDLITSFEVFEHVPDPRRLVDTLAALLRPDGVVYFSTLVTEASIVANQRLTWWYAAPRNGHISLYTRDSLARLGKRQGFRFGSIDSNLHTYWRSVPDWARHLFAPV